jgi:plasmid stability protein
VPEVLVRNLDEQVVERLKARARAGGRSLQAELKRVLEAAAQGASARKSYRGLAAQLRRALAARPHPDSADLVAEDRRR